MKKGVVIGLVISLLGIARAGELRPYVRAGLGPMITEDSEASGSSYPAGSEIQFDLGFTVSGAVGVECENCPVRAELEYNFVKYYSDEANFAGFRDGNKLVWHVFMANFYYDFKNDSLITPFVTAGLGYTLEESDVDAVLAYQFGGGLAFEMTEKTSLDVAYRYFTVEDPEFTSPAGNYEAEFVNHLLMFGLRYTF
ncbi:outer membrane protein, partial [Verrucomicrobiota bacterium]